MADEMPGWQRQKVGMIFALVVGTIAGVLVGLFEPLAFADVAGSSVATVTAMWILFKGELQRWRFRLFMAAVVIVHSILVFALIWPVRYKIGDWDIGIVGLGDFFGTLTIGLLGLQLTGSLGKPHSDA